MNEFWTHFSENFYLYVNKYNFLFVVVAWAEAATSIAAAFMSQMIPLRMLAVANNVLGFVSGIASGSLPSIFKHSVNYRLNSTRLKQMRQLIDKVQKANDTDLNVDWLKPFMKTRSLKSGNTLFSRGDNADEAFVIISGEIYLKEVDITLTAGALFGEMALFSNTGSRTATAICKTDVTLAFLTYDHFEQLYFQNQTFGLYLIRLIVRRFEMNQSHR